MKYLGIDYGTKKIGLAIGDDQACIAMPFSVVKTISEIQKIIKEEYIDALVIGVPKKVGDFHSNVQLEKTEKFISSLQSLTGLKIYRIDESHTSVESQRLQKEQGATAKEDALAAMLILQAFFDENT